ncbi:MAG: GYF domain-containing protein [Acidobacteriota bacterium]
MSSEDASQTEPAAESWYYVRRGEPRGPVTMRYLKALFDNGELGAETLIRGPGVERWSAAAEVEEPAFVAAAPDERRPTPEDLPERISLEAAGGSLAVYEEMALSESAAEDDFDLAVPEIPSLPEPPPIGAIEADPSGEDELLQVESGPSPYDLSDSSSSEEAPPPSPYEAPEAERPVEEDGLSLDDVLGEVERHREDAVDRRRRQEIRKASLRLRFEDLSHGTIKPALRTLMQRLHKQGYPTRLRQIDKHQLRFEFTLETSRLIRCRLEIALKPKGLVEFVFLRDLQELSQELVHLDDLDDEKIHAKIAAFVKMSLQG